MANCIISKSSDSVIKNASFLKVNVPVNDGSVTLPVKPKHFMIYNIGASNVSNGGKVYAPYNIAIGVSDYEPYNYAVYTDIVVNDETISGSSLPGRVSIGNVPIVVMYGY